MTWGVTNGPKNVQSLSSAIQGLQDWQLSSSYNSCSSSWKIHKKTKEIIIWFCCKIHIHSLRRKQQNHQFFCSHKCKIDACCDLFSNKFILLCIYNFLIKWILTNHSFLSRYILLLFWLDALLLTFQKYFSIARITGLLLSFKGGSKCCLFFLAMVVA